MPEPLTSPESVPTRQRPFPWFCPRCRRKEVRLATIPYQCPRLYRGQPITVVVSNLAVPRCDNCGELIFDYQAEEQINRAFQAQTKAIHDANGANQAPGSTSPSHSSTPPAISTS